jgi:hypothetical protein
MLPTLTMINQSLLPRCGIRDPDDRTLPSGLPCEWAHFSEHPTPGSKEIFRKANSLFEHFSPDRNQQIATELQIR